MRENKINVPKNRNKPSIRYMRCGAANKIDIKIINSHLFERETEKKIMNKYWKIY